MSEYVEICKLLHTETQTYAFKKQREIILDNIFYYLKFKSKEETLEYIKKILKN